MLVLYYGFLERQGKGTEEEVWNESENHYG